MSVAHGIFSHVGFLPTALLVALLFVASAVKRFALATTSLVFTSSLFVNFVLTSDLLFVQFF
jgi:hypothetical protein